MEPVPSPPWMGAQATLPPLPPTKLPRMVLMGFVLAGLGVVFTGVSYGWNYFGLRSGLGGSIYNYIQVEILLGLVELLLLQLGLFFIFLGVLRVLPRVRPWAWVGPMFILVGTLVVVGFDLVNVTLFSSPGGGTLPEWTTYVFLATLIVGSVLITLGLLISLFAVAKAVLLRTPSSPGLPHP